MRSFTVVDLFSGCGMFSLAFKEAGFNVTCAVEIDKSAADTYATNHPNTIILVGDIRTVKRDLFDYFPQGVDVVIGGPPCRSFSPSGLRGSTDSRGQLYKEYIDVVKHMRPKAFVMENVKGLLSMKHLMPGANNEAASRYATNISRYKSLRQSISQKKGRTSYEEVREFESLKTLYPSYKRKLSVLLARVPLLIINEFKKIGYPTTYKVLNAVNFGVPQKRERVFFIGLRDKNAVEANPFPIETHANVKKFQTLDVAMGTTKKKPWVTAREAIGDIADALEDEEFSHVFTKHKKETIEKIKKLQPGKSLYGYGEAWYRIIASEPTPTAKENHSGTFVHFEKHRTVSARELARIQSIPDYYRFCGSKKSVLHQIGDCVPFLLGKAIALAIKKHLQD